MSVFIINLRVKTNTTSMLIQITFRLLLDFVLYFNSSLDFEATVYLKNTNYFIGS